MSHPGSKSQSSSNGGVISVAVLGILVIGGLLTAMGMKTCALEKDRERATEARGKQLHRGPDLQAYAAHDVEKLYERGDVVNRYVVRLSRNNYLLIPDYAYEVLHGYCGRPLEDALPEVRAYEQAAAGEPQISLDAFKKLAVYGARRKYIIYPAIQLYDGRCIVTLTVRGARGQILRVTPAVFDVLVPGHSIRDQLPAIEVALQEHERKKATNE